VGKKEDRQPWGCRREFTCHGQGWRLLGRNTEGEAGSLKSWELLGD